MTHEPYARDRVSLEDVASWYAQNQAWAVTRDERVANMKSRLERER